MKIVQRFGDYKKVDEARTLVQKHMGLQVQTAILYIDGMWILLIRETDPFTDEWSYKPLTRLAYQELLDSEIAS